MAEPHRIDVEEHDLPGTEALLACTLALMTGYSQALQADLHPGLRLPLSVKIAANLELLAGQPLLSCAFRDVALGLRRRWQAMADCTREAAGGCDASAGPPSGNRSSADLSFDVSPPPQLH